MEWVDVISDFVQEVGFPIFVATGVLLWAAKFAREGIEELAKVRRSVDKLTEYMIGGDR